MNKFQKLIADSSSNVLKRRAGSLSTQAEIAQQTIVNTLKSKVSELELKVENLTDFAPNSTYSLRPGADNWNPSDWATQLQATKWELKLARMQYETAMETYQEFFEEIKGI